MLCFIGVACNLLLNVIFKQKTKTSLIWSQSNLLPFAGATMYSRGVYHFDTSTIYIVQSIDK